MLLPFVFVAAISAATPASLCSGAPSRSWCSCGGRASIGRAMDSAALVAIAVFDSTAPHPASSGDALTWPIRIERAWKWPGGGAAPPRQVVVVSRADAAMCAIRITPGDRQLVVAAVRPADGALVLGHKCATPWGAVDTLGPTARDVRRFAGDNAVRIIAGEQARMLDSLLTFGPGTAPLP